MHVYNLYTLYITVNNLLPVLIQQQSKCVIFCFDLKTFLSGILHPDTTIPKSWIRGRHKIQSFKRVFCV